VASAVKNSVNIRLVLLSIVLLRLLAPGRPLDPGILAACAAAPLLRCALAGCWLLLRCCCCACIALGL
jgi:hypothetical protein